jgi:hypothetical protein
MNNSIFENLMETTVTYSIEINGQLFLIENVPARVNQDTGEQLFAPSTVEKIQQIINEQKQPTRFIQTPVYEFVA